MKAIHIFSRGEEKQFTGICIFSLVFGESLLVLLFSHFPFSPELLCEKFLATLSFCLSAFFLSPDLVLSFNDYIITCLVFSVVGFEMPACLFSFSHI